MRQNEITAVGGPTGRRTPEGGTGLLPPLSERQAIIAGKTAQLKDSAKNGLNAESHGGFTYSNAALACTTPYIENQRLLVFD